MILWKKWNTNTKDDSIITTPREDMEDMVWIRMTPKQKIASTLFYSLSNINYESPQNVTLTMQQYKTCMVSEDILYYKKW